MTLVRVKLIYVPNEELSQEDVTERGGTAPHVRVLKLRTSRSSFVTFTSFTLRPRTEFVVHSGHGAGWVYSRSGGMVGLQLVRGQGGSTAGLGAAERNCKLQFAPVYSQPLISRCPSSIPVTIPTELFQVS